VAWPSCSSVIGESCRVLRLCETVDRDGLSSSALPNRHYARAPKLSRESSFVRIAISGFEVKPGTAAGELIFKALVESFHKAFCSFSFTFLCDKDNLISYVSFSLRSETPDKSSELDDVRLMWMKRS
jgi:hypothetical protein